MYTYLCNKQTVTCRVMQCIRYVLRQGSGLETKLLVHKTCFDQFHPYIKDNSYLSFVSWLASFILCSGLVRSLASPSQLGCLWFVKGSSLHHMIHSTLVTHLHSCYMYLEYGVREYCNVIGQCLDSRILSGLANLEYGKSYKKDANHNHEL